MATKKIGKRMRRIANVMSKPTNAHIEVAFFANPDRTQVSIDYGDGNKTNLSRAAVLAAFAGGKHQTRFNGMALAYGALMGRVNAMNLGIGPEELLLLQALQLILNEASEGDYTNPLWPEEATKTAEGKRRTRPPTNRSVMYATNFLVRAARVQHFFLGLSVAEACRKTIADTERLLQPAHVSLENIFPTYTVAHSGDPRSARRQRPLSAGDGPEDKLSRLSKRLKSWVGRRAEVPSGINNHLVTEADKADPEKSYHACLLQAMWLMLLYAPEQKDGTIGDAVARLARMQNVKIS